MGPSIKDHPQIIGFPPLIYAVPFLIFLMTHLFFPWHLVSGFWSQFVGWPLLIIGLGMGVWGKKTMEQAGTHVNPYYATKTIVTKGPFRFTRNPLYIALTLIYVAISVLLNTAWPLVALPMILLVVHYGVIKQEEAYLERKFGADYAEYKTNVRRWI